MAQVVESGKKNVVKIPIDSVVVDDKQMHQEKKSGSDHPDQ